LLDSALDAPWAEFAGTVFYPTLEEMAARLAFGLVFRGLALADGCMDTDAVRHWIVDHTVGGE
jgi:hypothetical protein